MKAFLWIVIAIFSFIPAFAQEADAGIPAESELSSESAFPTERMPAREGFLAAPLQRGDFWVCSGVETVFYSSSGVSVGGNFALAYGSRASFGFKAAWFFDTDNELDTLELNFLLRYYFTPSVEGAPSAGAYLQLMGGPAVFFDKAETAALPAKWGSLSAGVTFGWRFLLGKMFFAEPYVRAGYPYIIGAGVFGGVHF